MGGPFKAFSGGYDSIRARDPAPQATATEQRPQVTGCLPENSKNKGDQSWQA
jgi:hypothetical protein